jgi:hypothetical protein
MTTSSRRAPFMIPVTKRFPVENQSVRLDNYRKTLNYHHNSLNGRGRCSLATERGSHQP